MGRGLLDATLAPPREAVFFSAQAVRKQFETGGLLLDAPGYKLDAARRTGPGEVELHEHVVDVMRVVAGHAKVVTGETTHELNEGDVLVIPNRVSHQFIDASDPFLYFVTKVEV